MSHIPSTSPPPGAASSLSPLVGQIRPSHTPPATRFTTFSPPAERVGLATERVSLAHDYLLVMRGAERTFAAMAELYSRAPIFTLLYDEQGTDGRFAGREITTSPLQRLGAGQSNFRRLLPLYPTAVGRLRPSASDVVISSSSAFAHGLRAPEGSVHICYCYTPFRYAWDEQEFALGEVSPALRPLLRHQLRRIRRWDLAASRRVDAYIAISQLGRERIKRCYGRDAAIVHPPVETHRFLPGTPGDSLLVVSELVRHKRVHVALEAARRARVPIRVVGSGPDHATLQAAYPEAEFLGRAGDEDLVELYATARAVIVPSVEEFGITVVEAQAAGRPVIAAAAGGALETVLDGHTGSLVKVDDVDAFTRAIAGIDKLDFDPADARANAERFSVAAFQRRLADQVNRAVNPSGASPAHDEARVFPITRAAPRRASSSSAQPAVSRPPVAASGATRYASR